MDWFRTNFEDPAYHTPHDEGEYVYIWGGPFDAREELEDVFGSVATEAAITAAVEEVEAECWEWAPSRPHIAEVD